MKKINHPIQALTLLLFISTAGFAQWTTNTSSNTPVCVAAGAQRDARIIEDGMNGCFISWRDNRSSPTDIYVQHLNSAGFAQWPVNGLGACTHTADQSTAQMVSDGQGGIIVTWSDWRAPERDIYAQRINSFGVLQWTLTGAVVTDKPIREHNEKIVSDGAGGCIIAWEEEVSISPAIWDIRLQRLNSNGVIQWTAGGVAVTTSTASKLNPKLQKDNNGGVYVIWQDLRNGFEYDIYGQHFNGSGVRLWDPGGLAVCSATNDQINPKVDPCYSATAGGIYVAWTDQRDAPVGSNVNDIYCHRIDSLGNPLWFNNGVAVCTATNNQSAVDISASASTNGVILTWKDDRAGNTDIYAQRLNPAGLPQWTLDGMAVASSTLPQLNPNIIGDGEGGAIICYQDSTISSQWDIKAQRLSASGTKLWPVDGAVISDAAFTQRDAKNVGDDFGGTIVVWEDYRTGQRDIYAQYFNMSPTAVSEANTIANVSVYPNPFAEQLEVEFNLANDGDFSLRIMNVIGQEVSADKTYHRDNNRHSVSINTHALPPGFYFLEIRGKNYLRSVKVVRE